MKPLKPVLIFPYSTSQFGSVKLQVLNYHMELSATIVGSAALDCPNMPFCREMSCEMGINIYQ